MAGARALAVRYCAGLMAADNQVLSVLLPAGAEAPIQVYVNGEE